MHGLNEEEVSAWKDMHWVFTHYEDLKQRYPEQYVAVYQHAVVDHDNEMKGLMARPRQRYGEKAGSVATEFITAKKDELILRESLLLGGPFKAAYLHQNL